VKTRIRILHEEGPKEPWIRALSEPPTTKGRVLDEGMRWGIEPMFPDFQSRGFGSTKTQRPQADRIERLLLVLAVALYWAASPGMALPEQSRKHTQKKRHAA
jgi:hypothetical protein